MKLISKWKKSAPTLTLFYNSNKVLVKKSLSQNDYQSFCSAEFGRVPWGREELLNKRNAFSNSGEG